MPAPAHPRTPGPAEFPSAPVLDSDRVASLDVLRGVAVLGILAMNIRNFALPLRDFDNPRHANPHPSPADSPLAPADLWSWALTNVFCEDKFIALFSILFGAGIVVFGERLAAAGRPALLHYRRMFWLLVIGLAHAYLLWYGDILNTYALCGMLLWPLRRLKPAFLIGLGVAVLMTAVWIRVGPGMYESLVGAADQPPGQRAVSHSRQVFQRALRTEEAAYRGSYLDLLAWRANLNTAWHFYGVISFNFWRCAGFMLIGMALLRLRVLDASRSTGTYWGMLIAGYGLGLTLTLLGFQPTLAETLNRAPELSGGGQRVVGWLSSQSRYIGAAGVALGHLALVMILYRRLWGTRLVSPLAAVGRMALTNYLLHTLICILIFDGWAFGQWHRWTMSQLYALVAGIFLVQLVVSPVWLRFHQFGPAEWLWRSLTYWRAQPWRKITPAVHSAP